MLDIKTNPGKMVSIHVHKFLALRHLTKHMESCPLVITRTAYRKKKIFLLIAHIYL